MANGDIIIDVIGLDMDGVLVDLANYQFSKGIPFFSKLKSIPANKIIKDEKAYDVEDVFGVSHAHRTLFWAKYIWGYCLTQPAREDASQITHKWHNEGRKVKIITSRVYVDLNNPWGELFRKMVYYWLDKNNIYYDEVVFCSEEYAAFDKYEVCKNNDVKLMIDDKIDNINMIARNNIVLAYDNPWNQELEETEIIKRIHNFKQADDFIKKYELEHSRKYINLPRKSVK